MRKKIGLIYILLHLFYCIDAQHESFCNSLEGEIINDYFDSELRSKNYKDFLAHFDKFLPLLDSFNCQRAKSTMFMALGNIYEEIGNYQEAKFEYERALKIRQNINDTIGIVSVYNNFILLEHESGFPNHGLMIYEKVKPYIEKSYDDPSQINDLKFRIFINTAACFRKMKEYGKAEELYLNVLNDSKDAELVIKANQGLADIFNDTGKYPKALNYYQVVYSYYDSIGNKSIVAQLDHSIGLVYLRDGDTLQARNHFLKSAEISYKVQNNMTLFDAVTSLKDLPANYLRNKELEYYLEKWLLPSVEKIGNHKERGELLEVFAEHATDKGDYQTAYEYQKIAANILTDSILVKVQLEEQLTAKYEKEKALQEKQRFINSLIIGLLLLTIIALFYIRKKELEKNKIQEEKKSLELEHTSEILGLERNLREQLAFETHDIKTDAATVRNKLHFLVDHHTTMEKPGSLLDNIYQLAESLLTQIRRVNKALDPDKNEWYLHLERLLKTLEKSTNIKTQIHKSPELNDLIETDFGYRIYTILKVLIDNVEEHSKAKHLKIDIRRNDDKLNIHVEDDGIGGFEYPKNEGIGLRSVRKRVGHMNGTINFETKEGTKIEIDLPL